MANQMELELLYQALSSPIGIVVSTSDIKIAIQRLYTARRNSGDPSLDILQFRRSPFLPQIEFWIVKGKEKNAKT